MIVTKRHITDYLDYLLSAGFTVTLHGRIVSEIEFLKYNYHQNPFCHTVKSVYSSWNTCICNQKKIFEKCKNGAFFGCCYAGMGEFIFPIKNSDCIIGFISVSGFMSADSAAKAAHLAKKLSVPKEEFLPLLERYLNPDTPPIEAVAAAINPLVFMLEAYAENDKKDRSSETHLYDKMLRYITENCHRSIKMSELAENFNYSVSTLSHLFKARCSKSLPEYICALRLQEAKEHLIHSDSSITEIAQFLGFNSGNYFSAVFKKKFGITPKKYREKHRKS